MLYIHCAIQHDSPAHFNDEKTGSERFSGFPNVTQLRSGRVRIQISVH